MKFLVLLFSLLFAINTQATYFPPQKTLTIGGRTFVGSEVDNLIILYAYTNGATQYATFRKVNAATGYQVVTSPLKCHAVKTRSSNANSLQLYYADGDAGWNNGASCGTAPCVALGEGTLAGQGLKHLGYTLTGDSEYEDAIYWEIPVGKYPGINMFAAGAVTAYCLY